MDVKDFASTLKEWFFDLAGIFLPGATIIFISNLIYLNHMNAHSIPFYYVNDAKINFIYVITAYVIGYVIYGISIFIDYVLNYLSRFFTAIPSEYNKKSDIINFSNELHLFKKEVIARSSFEDKSDLEQFINNANFDEIRSMAMSYSPESDSKIYNFRFRYDLCNNLGTVFIIACVFGVVKSVFTAESIWFFSIAFFVIGIMFKIVRMKYLDASYKVPFSIANVKLLSKIAVN